MKIIYAGTPEFAVPPLEKLIENGHNIIAVITQPDRKTGRKQILTPPPVKIYAQKRGIKVCQFEKIGTHTEQLKAIGADIMITCAYGQILTQQVLDIFPLGVLNIHASLLPKYRGASPISAAILNGDKKTGITVMQTEKGLDTGDILYTLETTIKDGEKCGELTERLSVLGAAAINNALKLLKEGKIKPIPQDDSLAITVKTIKKNHAFIDFNMPVNDIYNAVRAYNPWPVAYTSFSGGTLKIYAAEVTNIKAQKPGSVIFADKNNGLIISAADFGLKITALQPSGKNIMTAQAFISGGKLKTGDILGQ